VQRYEVTPAQGRTDGGTRPLYRAIKWMPYELSFVSVPADPMAGTRGAEGVQKRSQLSRGVSCEFIRAAAQPSEETTMTEAELQAQREQQEAATRAATEAADAAAPNAAVAAERQRTADITSLCQRHGVAAERVQEFITSGITVDAVRTALLDEIAAARLRAATRARTFAASRP
jgi:N-acetyl-gamma-glutamylphosphate reductase